MARRAVPADAAELTRLRSVMFEAMGTAADDGWQHVSSVATDPQWRRRGMARATLEALLDWFADRGVASVTLEALYRSLGFADPEHRALRLTIPDRWAPGGERSRRADPPGGSELPDLPDLGGQLTAGDAHP